jgi:hypothetical protein
MILRIWHLSDAPTPNQIGTPYLHGEVEDWMAGILKMIPEEEWEAPDLSVTDAAGVTTFVAAFGLYNVGVADVQGIGRLANYPLEMVFAGIACRLFITNPTLTHDEEVERDYPTTQSDNSVLRLRGLIVSKPRQEEILQYVESRKTRPDEYGKLDLML